MRQLAASLAPLPVPAPLAVIVLPSLWPVRPPFKGMGQRAAR